MYEYTYTEASIDYHYSNINCIEKLIYNYIGMSNILYRW